MKYKYIDTTLNLEILAEEASEIIQAKSKIIRFGLTDYHPKNEYPNDKQLAHEIGHLMFLVQILVDNKTIKQEDINEGYFHKKEKMPKWYNYKKGSTKHE